MNDSKYESGLNIRREVLGDDYVDKTLADSDELTIPLQQLVTENSWGTLWVREGLDKRTRSLITVSMLVAQRATNEDLLGVFRSRNERLWTDRYQSLVRVLELSESIKRKFHSSQSDELSIQEYSQSEKQELEKSWAGARLELNREFSRLRLLFKERESENLVQSIQDLDRAISNSFATEGKDRRHALNVVWSKADSCVNEAIRLARKRCL